MSLLLPVSLGISPVTGIIMLAGTYYGSMYGGSTTSILVNIPGEAASVVTTLDGYQMALQAGLVEPWVSQLSVLSSQVRLAQSV